MKEEKIGFTIEEIIGQVCGVSMSLAELKKLNIRKETKDELTKRFCETMCASYIREFATQIPDLSEENLTELTQTIIKTQEIEEKCDFLAEVPNLTEENNDILLRSIFLNSETEIPREKVKIN